MTDESSSAPVARLQVGRLDIALSILVLFNLAFAQPVLDLLGKNPTFFVARRSPRTDILLLAFGFTLLVPLFAAVVADLAGLVHRRARSVLHVAALVVLGTLFALQIERRLPGIRSAPGLVLVLLGILIAVAGTYVFYRAPWAKTLVRVASPIPLVVLALFLLASPVSKVVLGSAAGVTSQISDIGKPAHVVMVVFDEFPITSLMDARGGIDRSMFPNFATLAQGSTWFRNATTVHDFTDKAVPAILTGRYTKRGQLPTVQDHPDNLFTLLQRAYTIRAVEPLTQLCPVNTCKQVGGQEFVPRWKGLLSDVEVIYEHVTLPADLRKNTPRIDTTWGHFRREAARLAKGRAPQTRGPFAGKQFGDTDPKVEFAAFLNAIQPTSGPHFDFMHVALPHGPWRHLPTGQSFPVPNPTILALNDKVWANDEWATTTNYQRHLAQTAYVDRVVGELVARLKRLGLYDDTLIVFTADHGVSFRPGKPYRHIRQDTVGEIAAVPLFMKLPRQTQGEVNDDPVETVDIVPTMADVLGVAGLYPTDGESALQAGGITRGEKIIFNQSFVPTRFSGRGQEKFAIVKDKLRLFGSRGGIERLYAVTPPGTGALLGRPARADGESGITALVANLDDYENVDPKAAAVPALVFGTLEGAPSSRVVLAVAINGTIGAVTRSIDFEGIRFTSLLPSEAFRPGRNVIELFRVDGSRLERVRVRGAG